MTFEMVRIGWPNTAAILALAIMPIVSLTAAAEWRPDAVQTRQADAATVCPAPSLLGGMVVAALVPGGTVLE